MSYYNSLLDVFRTIYVCIVLSFGAVIFTRDSNELVLYPIQRMIAKVNKIARNPLSAKYAKIVKILILLNKNINIEIQVKEKDNFETFAIENAITKIGTLLAIGFGEAGSEIIAANIGQGDINPLLAGEKRCAIFGFCDVR